MSRLYLSFWSIGLDNLPEGTVRRLRLTPDAAKLRIDQARAAGDLMCVSDDDLLAPYCERERRNHDDLRRVLREQFDIDLSLKDFCNADEDEDGPLYFINALSFARVEPGSALMVVTCSFIVTDKKSESDATMGFATEPTSVEFHIIETA